MNRQPSGLTLEQYLAWPSCAVPGCPNKCCRRLSSIYCYPHTFGIRPDQMLPESESRSLVAEKEGCA